MRQCMCWKEGEGRGGREGVGGKERGDGRREENKGRGVRGLREIKDGAEGFLGGKVYVVLLECGRHVFTLKTIDICANSSYNWFEISTVGYIGIQTEKIAVYSYNTRCSEQKALDGSVDRTPRALPPGLSSHRSTRLRNSTSHPRPRLPQ